MDEVGVSELLVDKWVHRANEDAAAHVKGLVSLLGPGCSRQERQANDQGKSDSKTDPFHERTLLGSGSVLAGSMVTSGFWFESVMARSFS